MSYQNVELGMSLDIWGGVGLVLYADFIGLLNTEPLLSSGGFFRVSLDCLSDRY